MVDSSPQFGHDWLLAEMTVVADPTKLRQACQAIIDILCQMPYPIYWWDRTPKDSAFYDSSQVVVALGSSATKARGLSTLNNMMDTMTGVREKFKGVILSYSFRGWFELPFSHGFNVTVDVTVISIHCE